MPTRLNLIKLLVLVGLVVGCTRREDGPLFAPSPLAPNTWSQGCAQLTPTATGFRLDGLCCAYLDLPAIQLDGRRQFSQPATYYSFNGAGYSPLPVLVSGGLSTDGDTLTISYLIGPARSTHQLQPGPARLACDCACF